jgi:hypothetical protein
VLEITFDLLERANALALEMAFAGDRVNGCCRKSMLNLQPIAHHALKQFALYFCHNVKLPFRGSGHKAQLPSWRWRIGGQCSTLDRGHAGLAKGGQIY